MNKLFSGLTMIVLGIVLLVKGPEREHFFSNAVHEKWWNRIILIGLYYLMGYFVD